MSDRTSWRSGEHGYGWVTKVLHWLTVLLVAGQFLVGYSMELDEPDCDPPGERRSGGDTSDRFEERLDRLEEQCEAESGDFQLVGGGFDLSELHLGLGLLILVIAVVRPLWRRYDGFPPWSEHLGEAERRLVHWTERSLMALLFVVPLTGIVLIASGDDHWVPLHVGAHVAFFAALGAHLFTNLRPKILRRMV